MPKPPPKPAGKGSAPTPRPGMGLGRGLTEIITQGARVQSPPPAGTPGSQIRQIPLQQIDPNPRQPRHRFSEEPLEELTASIREHGVLQAITVRPVNQRFEIIAGERRFRASQKAGLTTIQAIVKVVSDEEAAELALIENLQREDLDPIEEATGYRRLMQDFSLTQEQVAKKVGRNRVSIANALRLLDLPDDLQALLGQGHLTSGHAKAILGLTTAETQIQTAHDVIRQGLNVRQTEALVQQRRDATHGKKMNARGKKAVSVDPHLSAIQEALQQKLGTKVHLVPSGSGGKIEIHYFTPTDLDRILELWNIRL